MENTNQNKESQNIDANRSFSVTLGFIHKKTEKLVTAVYMLSNFFPHQEPLRWEVRTFSLNLLGNVSFVFYGKNSETEHILKESGNAIDEIISRFEIAHISGLVSTMNFSVLKNELVSLKDNIESIKKGGGGQNILITSDFFAPDKLLEGSQRSDLKGSQRSDLSAPIEVPALRSGITGSIDLKRSTLQVPRSTTPKAPEAHEAKEARSLLHSVASKRKGDRSETILKILKKKDNLTVKDIAQVISDCSEKTIQRELLALVEKSVLKKVGERRWSRYSLA